MVVAENIKPHNALSGNYGEGDLRPVVCLKSGVKLQVNASGGYDLIQPDVVVTENQATLEMTEDESNTFDSLFTVTTKDGGTATRTYKLNGTTTNIRNTSDLAVGTHTLECTATYNGVSDTAYVTIVVEAAIVPWDGTIATSFAGGTGTEADPYLIETPQQLAYLVSFDHESFDWEKWDAGGYEKTYYKIINDLDLGGIQDSNGNWSGQNWAPGLLQPNTYLDGNNMKIYNLYTTNGGLMDIASWGFHYDIVNMHIGSGYVYGESYAGRICGVS